jgi:hypothetical protein
LIFGGGYAYTYFQVKDAASNIFSNAEVVDLQIENIGLIPPSADLTLYIRVYNPSGYGFTYSAKIELYIGDNYFTTFQVEDEFIKANEESIAPITCKIGGGALSLLNSIIGDPVYRYEAQMEVIYKIFGIIPITITEFESGYEM